MRSPIAVALAMIAVNVLLAGCVENDAEAGDGPDARDAVEAPLVHSGQEGDRNFFAPETITVAAGMTVTWDVTGPGHHTVTFANDPNTGGDRTDSGDFGPGETWTYTFEQPGTYPYWCRYHSNGKAGMVGTVVVT